MQRFLELHQKKQVIVKVKEFVQSVVQEFDLNNILIKASVRRFINNSELEKQYHELLNDNWWHAM